MLGRRGVPVREDVRAPLRTLTDGREARAGRVARIVVAGAGAIGASRRVPPRLARRARRRPRRPRRASPRGATAKAMGGVRQQFSTAAEVRLAQASIRFFEELGPPLFDQVGYLFLATTEEGLAELEERRELQAELGVPVEQRRPVVRRRACAPTTCSARSSAARTASPTRPRSRVSSSGARRKLGVERARGHATRATLDARRARDRVRALVGRARRDARRRAAGPAALPPAARDRRAAEPARRPADGARGRERLPLPPARQTGSCSR